MMYTFLSKTSRKAITGVMIQNVSNKWNAAINKKNSKELWQCINWKGDYNDRSSKIHPPINELKTHFAEIYQSDDPFESEKK